MSPHALSYLVLHRRRCRAFFLPRTTQQMRSLTLLREIARAATSIAALVAWGGLVLLLAG